MTPNELSKNLKNIGITFSKKLINAGIDTPQKLKKLGSKEAFLQIYKSGGFCDKFNALYLYALEGAILNCDWKEIPKETKAEFKNFTKNLREKTNV